MAVQTRARVADRTHHHCQLLGESEGNTHTQLILIRKRSNFSVNLTPSPLPPPSLLQVKFEFRSLVTARLGSLVFDEVARTMTAAFESNCEQVYGASHLKQNGRGTLKEHVPLSLRDSNSV